MCRILKFSFLTFLLVGFWSCSNDDNLVLPETPESPELPETPEVPEEPAVDLITSDSLVVNPSGFAPLSAQIGLKTSQPVTVAMRVAGKNGPDSDVVHTFTKPGSEMDVPVHGLYADYANEVILDFFDAAGDTLETKIYEIQTAPLNIDLPEITIDKANLDQMFEGMTLVNYLGYTEEQLPAKPFIFDAWGDIRWYLDYTESPILSKLFYDNGLERLENGNFYFAEGADFGGGGSDTIYEIDLFGTILNTWEMPGYAFHHDVVEKPNGNFLVSASKIGAPTIEDYIIEIGRDSKSIVNTWDLNFSLDNSRTTLTDNTVDWIHVNAVAYDASDDTIIVSGRTQAMVKLTQDNEVVWIMGPHAEWNTSGSGKDLNQYLLQPLDSQGNPITDAAVLSGTENHPDFEWNWYQHATKLMPNGHISLFDNGDNRNFTGAEEYSRAVEYEIDAANMTVKQIWQYGKDRGAEMYSRIVSDVDYLADKNHMLISPGASGPNAAKFGKSIEVDYSSGEIIFEATIKSQKALSEAVVLHRTERLSLYPN